MAGSVALNTFLLRGVFFFIFLCAFAACCSALRATSYSISRSSKKILAATAVRSRLSSYTSAVSGVFCR